MRPKGRGRGLQAAGIKLTAGISGPVAGADGLAGALREASGARRAAAMRPAAYDLSALPDRVDFFLALRGT